MRKPAPQFDSDFNLSHSFFYGLLKNSLSLDLPEKIRVLEALPTLRYKQVIALQQLFISEYMKFEILNQQHPRDIEILVARMLTQWIELEEMYEFPPLLSNDEFFEHVINFVREHGLDDDAQETLEEFERLHSQDTKSADDDDSDDVDEIDTPNHHDDNEGDDECDDETTTEEHDDDDNQPMTKETPKELWRGVFESESANDDTQVQKQAHKDDEDKGDFNHATFRKTESFRRFYQKNREVQQARMNAEKSLNTSSVFNTPKEAIEETGKKVIGQNHALEKLATMLYYHRLFHNEALKAFALSQSDNTPKKVYSRQMPVLLIGSTGTGKTHLVQNLAKLYGQTVTFVDCSVLVRAGIIGISVDTIGRMIYENSGEDLQKAEYSIVFLDEFDKLFLPRPDSNGASNADLATQLLTMVEGSAPIPVEYRGAGSPAHYPTFLKSDNMMFILAGSFGMHTKFLGKSIGFHQSSAYRLDDFTNHQTGLTELGLPDELAGRIGQVIRLNPLSDDDYVKVMYQSPTSPWCILQNQLSMVECSVELPEEVVRTLIKKNQFALQKFGARGLYQAFNALPCITKILLQALEAPNQHFVITLD